MMFMKKYLYSLAQNWHTTEISVFDFENFRNLINISINYDIYKEKIYDIYLYTWPL